MRTIIIQVGDFADIDAVRSAVARITGVDRVTLCRDHGIDDAEAEQVDPGYFVDPATVTPRRGNPLWLPELTDGLEEMPSGKQIWGAVKTELSEAISDLFDLRKDPRHE